MLPANGVKPLPQVKNIIAVASGKGGVGKSTVAYNLAFALQALGYRVGLLDADIYGPSLALLLGTTNQRAAVGDDKLLEPVVVAGIQTMSIAYLIEASTPAVWRGPMVSGALQQLCTGTRWQNLDYLLVDLPPGTGDVQLTLAQKIPVAAAVVVTTPQDLALLDVEKAIQMFQRVKVPVIGVIENMVQYTCSNCGHSEHVFGHGGGERLANLHQIGLLGRLPLHLAMQGKFEISGECGEIFMQVAREFISAVNGLPRDLNVPLAKIVIEEI